MRFPALVLLATALATAAFAQSLLNANDATALALRISQLMESTAATLPGLVQTSADITQSAKKDVTGLQANANNAPLSFDFLNQARAYLALTDAIPKPFPMPETARKQFIELREGVERFQTHFQALLAQKERQIRPPDRDNLHRYADANAKLGPPSPKLTRVVFMGDSITDFWRLNEYFTGREYINRGISGQVTGEILGRMKADVIDLKPAVVAILGGTNDLARNVPLATIENNLTMMADLAAASGIKVVLSSVLPVSDVHKRANPLFEQTPARQPVLIKALNDWLERFCTQRKLIYLDYFSALRDDGGMFTEDLSDDGLHPNGKGYRIMAPLLGEAAAKAAQSTKPPSRK